MRPFILATFLLLTSYSRWVFALEFCSANSPEGKRCRLVLEAVRPTQFSVGMREVELKTQKIGKMLAENLDDYLKGKPLDIVIGPGGIAYAIDGHHFALAALYSGIEEVYGVAVHNYSHLSEERFFEKMIRERLFYLFKNGEGPLDPRTLPTSLWGLENDNHRSLASAAKDAGAFKKSHNRFFEYIWTEFFRLFIKIDMNDEDGFQLALKAALALAHTNLAAGLPGYHKPHEKCSDELVQAHMEKYRN